MRTPVGTFLLPILLYNAIAVPDLPLQQPLGHVDSEASENGLPFSTSALEDYIEGSMEKWHAPGMAVAIINGNATWAKVSLLPPSHSPFHGSRFSLLINTGICQQSLAMEFISSHISTPRASATPPFPRHQ